MSEKVGGAEGTKLDDDFKEMERVSLNTDAYIHYYHSFFLSRTGISKLLSLNFSNNFERLNFYSAGLSFLFLISFCFLTKAYIIYGTLYTPVFHSGIEADVSYKLVSVKPL